MILWSNSGWIFSRTNIIRYIIFIIGLCVTLFFVFYFYKSTPVYIPGKEGVIYFSARTNKPGYLTSVFILDVASKKIFGIKATKPNTITNTNSISPEQNKNVYSEASLLKGKNDIFYIPNIFQLAVFDTAEGTTRFITHSNTYKTTPDWSPSGTLIAFASRTLTSGGLYKSGVGLWDIKISNLSGDESFITSGFQPQWFPDGVHLLILKEYGLYIVNKDTKDEQKLSGIEEIPMSTNMKMDLSRDGSRIALSLSESGRVFIIDLLSLENARAKVNREISGPAFWPIFSEDGNKLALYEVDINSLTVGSQSRISVYNLETSERKILYDLSAFDPRSIAITDWRK